MSRPTEPPLPAGVDPQLAAALRHHEDILTGLGPSDTSAAYAFFHGGGFRLGEPRSSDRQLRELALAWGGIVVSLDYAHMPEAVFPVAVEESAAALRWLSVHGARWGIDPARLAVGGSSAGASVAMGVAVHLGPGRAGFLRAGAFVVGVFDDDLDTASMRAHGDGPMQPSRRSAAAMFEAYAGGPGQRRDPRLDTRQADLGDMPPLFLAAAELDVYRDSSVLLARRLNGAGRSAELVVYPGTTHLFWGYMRIDGLCGPHFADAGDHDSPDQRHCGVRYVFEPTQIRFGNQTYAICVVSLNGSPSFIVYGPKRAIACRYRKACHW